MASRLSASLMPVFLAALGVALPAGAADHGDGRLGLEVVVGLAEGPPYPADAVQIAAGLRHPGGASLPLGELHLVLLAAEDAVSGDPIPLMGEATDNGEPFGEPGDTVSMDVYFVPGPPPNDDLSFASVLAWGQHAEDGPDAPLWQFTAGEPAVLEAELFFDDYEVRVEDEITGAGVADVPMQIRFEIAPGQDLAFEDMGASGPDANGDLTYTGTLRRVGAGSLDPSEPLYRITIASDPFQMMPALPPLGLALAGLALLVLGAASVHAAHRRAMHAPCPTDASRTRSKPH